MKYQTTFLTQMEHYSTSIHSFYAMKAFTALEFNEIETSPVVKLTHIVIVSTQNLAASFRLGHVTVEHRSRWTTVHCGRKAHVVRHARALKNM